MKKVYISGPITGMIDGNAAEFMGAQYDLQQEPDTIAINPVIIGNQLKLRMQSEPSWLDYMAADIPELLYCHEIYMLRKWWKSKGARIELIIAILFRKKIRFQKRRDI